MLVYHSWQEETYSNPSTKLTWLSRDECCPILKYLQRIVDFLPGSFRTLKNIVLPTAKRHVSQTAVYTIESLVKELSRVQDGSVKDSKILVTFVKSGYIYPYLASRYSMLLEQGKKAGAKGASDRKDPLLANIWESVLLSRSEVHI